jgi:hypothetical protein
MYENRTTKYLDDFDKIIAKLKCFEDFREQFSRIWFTIDQFAQKFAFLEKSLDGGSW